MGVQFLIKVATYHCLDESDPPGPSSLMVIFPFEEEKSPAGGANLSALLNGKVGF